MPSSTKARRLRVLTGSVCQALSLGHTAHVFRRVEVQKYYVAQASRHVTSRHAPRASWMTALLPRPVSVGDACSVSMPLRAAWLTISTQISPAETSLTQLLNNQIVTMPSTVVNVPLK